MVKRVDRSRTSDNVGVSERPRVVLMVTAEMTALTFYKGYVRFLTDRGWDVTVVCRSGGRLENWASGEGGRGLSINFARRPAPLADLAALVAVVRALRKIRPGVVVAATPKAGLLGTLGALLARVPVRQYQMWGLRLETERGLKRGLLWLMEKVAVKSSTQTVANSRSLAQLVEDVKLAQPGSVLVLGEGSSHGVDIDYFSPNGPLPKPPNLQGFLDRVRPELTVAFVGRLARDKGIDSLVGALAVSRQQGRKIVAVIVGGIEDDEVRAILQAASTEQVFLVDSVQDVRPYLRSSDVLCLPTRREGFPNVVLEAAAMEVPAVVSDATGSVDSVVDSVTGLVFPVGDVTALAGRLIALADSPELRRRMGRAARNRAVESFNAARIHRLQESVLREQYEGA